MVKAEFSFFQMQVEGNDGYSVELLQPAFCMSPEQFNAVDMMLAPRKFIGTVVHSVKSKICCKFGLVMSNFLTCHSRFKCPAEPFMSDTFGFMRHHAAFFALGA